MSVKLLYCHHLLPLNYGEQKPHIFSLYLFLKILNGFHWFYDVFNPITLDSQRNIRLCTWKLRKSEFSIESFLRTLNRDINYTDAFPYNLFYAAKTRKLYDYRLILPPRSDCRGHLPCSDYSDDYSAPRPSFWTMSKTIVLIKKKINIK